MTTPSTRQRLRDDDTVCDHCGERRAVCVGRYEDDGDPEYACDECCGHGSEDGWCVQFGEVGELLTSWRRHRKEQEKTIDRMEAVVRAAVTVPERIFEEGYWRPCSGCHETNEGHATGPYSETFRCNLGSGCHECGGIGATWEQFDEEQVDAYLASAGSEEG